MKNYFNIGNVFRVIGIALILFSISDTSTPDKAEDYLYIGIAIMAISYMFVSSSVKTEDIPQSMGSDSIVQDSEIWESISTQTSSFYTQRLVRYSNGMIKVRPTIKQTLFNLQFIWSGLFSLIVAFALYIILENYIYILPAVLGGVFLWLGFSNIEQKETVVFDLDLAQFSKQEEDENRVIPFAQIHGLQLIEEYNIEGRVNIADSDRYYSYELNLILKDADRVNVMSHGDKNEMIRDTKMLAAYLSVPIWHKL